ncbi:MAG: type II secretion system protein [Phycisphaerae bacterium]|jgi:type II secretory pathway pseudopilin PulG
MKTKTNKAFTLVELLTVMGIIIILISLIVPAVNQISRIAQNVRQTSQITTISTGLETFYNDFNQYPASSGSYAGAGLLNLADALVGRDMLGYAPDNNYSTQDNNRYGPYVEPDRINATAFYTDDDSVLSTGFPDPSYYIADVYRRDSLKYGMPILYYRANTNRKTQDLLAADEATQVANSIYNYSDSNFPFDATDQAASAYWPYFGEKTMPWEPDADGNTAHQIFSSFIKNAAVSLDNTRVVPYHPQSFLLISAGKDGEYGTQDDVCNFEKPIN